MPEENKTDGQVETQKGNEPPPPINNQNKDAIPKEETKADESYEPQSITKEIVPDEKVMKVQIVEDGRKDTNSIVANIISGGSLFLAAVIFYYTYLLFMETQKSTKAAIESARAAVIADSISVESLKLSQRSFDSSIAAGKDAAAQAERIFNLQEKSVIAQIKSLKESQKEFEIGNEPYLQIDSLLPSPVQTNKLFYVIVKTENLGKYPVKIINERLMLSIRVNHPSFNDLVGKKDSFNIPLNAYIINGKPFVHIVEYDRPVQEWQRSGLANGSYFCI